MKPRDKAIRKAANDSKRIVSWAISKVKENLMGVLSVSEWESTELRELLSLEEEYLHRAIEKSAWAFIETEKL